MTTTKAGTPPRKRQGSEKRQRTHVVRIPLLPEERHEIENAAAKAGLTLFAYVRARTLSAMPPRDGTRLQASREALEKLLPELRGIREGFEPYCAGREHEYGWSRRLRRGFAPGAGIQRGHPSVCRGARPKRHRPRRPMRAHPFKSAHSSNKVGKILAGHS